MKKFLCILAVTVLFHAGCFARSGPGTQTGTISPVLKVSAFQDPLPANAPGMRKMKTGQTLTVAGGIFLIVGTAMVATANFYDYSDTTGNMERSGDPKGVVGALFVAAGV